MAWSEILGQELTKRILRAHLASGQIASAYLLAGPDGVGKRRLALELAKALNCSAPSTPCDACPSCLQMSRGTHPDLHIVAASGASEQIRIDEIRAILGRIALRPFSAKWQVVIIDGVDRLTEEAANCLLKSLEEPSAHTRFVLTTSRLSYCLPTTISRCQLIRCHPLSMQTVKRLLIEIRGIDSQIAEVVASLSGGSISQALALAERWDAHQTLLARLAHGTSTSWIEAPLPSTRQELLSWLDSMMWWLRDLIVTASAGSGGVIQTAQRSALTQQASHVDMDHCLETAFELLRLRESVEQFVSPRLIAALAREHWLNLVEGGRSKVEG